MSFQDVRTNWRKQLQLLAAGAVAVALSACAEGPVAPPASSSGLDPAGVLFAKAAQVSVCHRTGDGSYQLLTINGNALAAHQAHGDALPGAAVPDGSGATFDEDCTPRAVDVTGTYVLVSVGGQSLPAQGNGEIMYSGTIVLHEGGSCSVSGESQPGEEIVSYTFQACSYSLDGTELTLDVVDERGEAGVMTAQLVDEQIIIEILVRDDGDESDEGYPADIVLQKV